MNGEFHIETERPRDELAALLKPLEPWRMEISFSNGFSTKELQTMEPWNRRPLWKLKLVRDFVGAESLTDKTVLDIGFNAGYNGIALTNDFGCQVTGIDIDPRNLHKATILSEVAKSDQRLEIADATTHIGAPVDIVLHFGTLYHLRDPLLALRTTARNLKPGGLLFLETATYATDEDMTARYINGLFGDRTNHWALGPPLLRKMLAEAGFSDLHTVKSVIPKLYAGTPFRRELWIGRRQ